MVVRPNSISGIATVLSGNQGKTLQLRIVDAYIQLLNQWSASYAMGDLGLSTTRFHVITATAAGDGSYSFWFNDVVDKSGTSTQVFEPNGTTVIGGAPDLSESFDGDIAEILRYDRVLWPDEIRSIVRSLMKKWMNTTPEPPTLQPANLADAIIADAFGGAHPAPPRDVPTDWQWAQGSVGDPNTNYTGFNAYGAVNIWSQVFVPQAGSGNYNVRILARNPRIWFYDGSVWANGVIPSGTAGAMGGSYWTGDYTPANNTAATIRYENSNAYSTSLQPLAANNPYDTFHYWWIGMFPRISIPSGTVGILVRSEMRLAPDDGYTTTVGANFMANTDADMFATPETTVDPKGWNDGLPQPRMKWVTDEWQFFYSTTLSIANLRASNPPKD